jgi:hypothetical protein
VDVGTEWPQISCTKCAGIHPGESRDVVHPTEVLEIVDAKAKIDALKDQILALESQKVNTIKKLLCKEGYKKGMTIYHRSKQFIVTGLERSRFTTMKVIMYPAKKDGTASKIYRSEMTWNDFIRLWRMQRADIDGYVKRCIAHDEEIRERMKKRKLKDSDFQ